MAPDRRDGLAQLAGERLRVRGAGNEPGDDPQPVGVDERAEAGQQRLVHVASLRSPAGRTPATLRACSPQAAGSACTFRSARAWSRPRTGRSRSAPRRSRCSRTTRPRGEGGRPSPRSCRRSAPGSPSGDIAPIAIHAPYLVNLAGPEAVFHERSIAVLANELRVGRAYGASFVNVHIGSHRGEGVDAGLARLTAGIVAALDRARRRRARRGRHRDRARERLRRRVRHGHDDRRARRDRPGGARRRRAARPTPLLPRRRAPVGRGLPDRYGGGRGRGRRRIRRGDRPRPARHGPPQRLPLRAWLARATATNMSGRAGSAARASPGSSPILGSRTSRTSSRRPAWTSATTRSTSLAPRALATGPAARRPAAGGVPAAQRPWPERPARPGCIGPVISTRGPV